MKIKTPNDEVILLPREVLGRVKEATGAELKVLLYLYAWKEAQTPEMASQLGVSPAEVEAAVAFWRGAGLFEADDSPEKKPVPASTSLFKNYDSRTISEHLDGDKAFRACCELVAEKLGKQLTKNDYSSLLYLCDYVGLPPEVVSGITEYCVSRGKSSMQYLMKTALSMYEKDGVDTYEKLEKYLARMEQIHTGMEQVRRLCGFGTRELTTKESEILGRWFGEWDLRMDLVRLAYEKTVDTLGKVSLSYMNAMLKRWYENGLLTPEDVAARDRKPEDGSAAGYTDSDEFFEAALKAGFQEE